MQNGHLQHPWTPPPPRGPAPHTSPHSSQKYAFVKGKVCRAGGGGGDTWHRSGPQPSGKTPQHGWQRWRASSAWTAAFRRPSRRPVSPCSPWQTPSPSPHKSRAAAGACAPLWFLGLLKLPSKSSCRSCLTMLEVFALLTHPSSACSECPFLSPAKSQSRSRTNQRQLPVPSQKTITSAGPFPNSHLLT